jgi:hypothetical protein
MAVHHTEHVQMLEVREAFIDQRRVLVNFSDLRQVPHLGLCRDNAQHGLFS